MSKSNRKELYISIGQKEKNVLLIIKETFGFGTLNPKKANNGNIYWYWTVYSKKDLEILATLFFNNIILLKRQIQFNIWIKKGKSIGMFKSIYYANLNKNNQKQIIKVSLKNGWFSGFIDGEGCFYAKTRQSKKDLSKIGIEQKLTLIQKDTSGYEKIVFEKILLLFKSKSKVYSFSRPNIKDSVYIQIDISSIPSQKILINYLFSYQLRTLKKKAFLKWYKLYLYRTNNFICLNTSSDQLIIHMTQLVKSMNKYKSDSYE